jgi:hypothetical protein
MGTAAGEDKIRGSFTALRMTVVAGVIGFRC